MAIVKMKKLHILALERERTALLEGLQPLGCVEISTPRQDQEEAVWESLRLSDAGYTAHWKAELSRTKTALAALERIGEVKGGMLRPRTPVSQTSFVVAQETAKLCEATITAQLQILATAHAEESRLRTRQSALVPWTELDVPLDYVGSSQVAHRLCVFPGNTDLSAVDLSQLPAVLEQVSGDKQQLYCTILYLMAQEEAVLEVLRPFGMSMVAFSDHHGTAKESLAQLDGALQTLAKTKEAATATIVAQVPQVEALRQYVDWLETQVTRASASEQLLTDDVIVYLEGWMPESTTSQVETLLQSLGCAWEMADPTEDEYSEVPVKLKSNWFTKPLSMVTEMYSLPAYNGVDPNPLMAPFFILFYGIMMADMGYGLVMLLGGGFVLKKAKPTGTMEHMAGLMCLCGVSTFIMGALTGGFFGDFIPQLAMLLNPNTTLTALPSLFTPLEDTLMILIGSMALGLVQIITGMAVSFVYKLRHGQVMDAIWEEVTWWLVFLGGGLAAAGITSVVLYVAGVMILVGAGWSQKGFGKITAIFGSLYNHITGYFGDILSYSRLMALMLAGSVIAQVFNTLGAIPGNVVVFIVISFAGNTLNFALNLLGCYVHDLRLQCLEYFGKFYMDGGRAFAPLAFQTKYVDVQNDLGGK